MITPSDKPTAPVKHSQPIALLNRSLFAVGFSWLILTAQPLHAQQADAPPLRNAENSVCVICNEPGKVYQCYYPAPDGVLAKPQSDQYLPDQEVKKVERVAPVNVRGLQFACIQELAQYGNHGQCAADRKTTAECGGEPYDLKQTAALNGGDVTPSTIDQTEGNAAEVAPVQKKPTLVDETKKTYQKTTETVKKGYNSTADTVESGYKKTSKTVKKTVETVGDSIGDAAKTTYKCLTSFFQKCGK